MLPQKPSLRDVIHELKNNIKNYGELYTEHLKQLVLSINSRNHDKCFAVLNQMADAIANYTDNDIEHVLLVVQSYKERLYAQELIGLIPIGSLAHYKNLLCDIQDQCTKKINRRNTPEPKIETEDFITKKSRSVKKNNATTDKSPIQRNACDLELEIQNNINTIRHARILAHFRQDNTLVGDVNTINQAIKAEWFPTFLNEVKEAVLKKDALRLEQVWHANFNNNCLHFKRREAEIKDNLVTKLKKDGINNELIGWFYKNSNTVGKKEFSEAYLKKISTEENPKKTDSAPTILRVLRSLKNITKDDELASLLVELPKIELSGTFSASQSIIIKSEIDQTLDHIYQSCMLGLYADKSQEAQLHIFDMCANALISFSSKLRKHLNESDETIQSYLEDAYKLKESCLYQIKIIQDKSEYADNGNKQTEKIITSNDLAAWKTIIQTRLTSEINRQNSVGVQEIMRSNFDPRKNPVLTETYEDILNTIKNMHNEERDKSTADWIKNNEKFFTKPNVQMPDQHPESQSVFQACKNHWMLCSVAMIAVTAGIYYLWEKWHASDEETADKNTKNTEQESTDETQKVDVN
jgi:hypothetical protein